ncbi:Uncharacterised protein [Klebsiella pneumoniae]|nr:Uncharacterised protein [Klebsiella pneumoniae]VGI78389.1 Uncharacterised protein [Klebsiella pneumoniae]
MMSLWDALRMNMMISYQELVRTFLRVITMKHKRTMPGLTPSVYCRDVRQDDGLK